MKLYYGVFDILLEGFKEKPSGLEETEGLISEREERRIQLLAVEEKGLILFVRDPNLPLPALTKPLRDLSQFYREPSFEKEIDFSEYTKVFYVIEDVSHLSPGKKEELFLPELANYVRVSLLETDLAILETRYAASGLNFTFVGDLIVFECDFKVGLDKAISEAEIKLPIELKDYRRFPRSVDEFYSVGQIEAATFSLSKEARKRLLPHLFEDFSKRKRKKERVL